MEAKKNPSKDVHRQRGVFFQISLIVSLGLIITAFEWRTAEMQVSFRAIDENESAVLPDIPVTNPVEPASPSLIKQELIPVKFLNLNKIIEVSSNTSTIDDSPPFSTEQTLTTQGNYLLVEDILETTESPFIFVENSAVPIGGFTSFYKALSKNLNYPKIAQRNEIEGRVFVEFIVNRNGSPSDLRIVKGIGYGCDEEAIRAIASTKWNPAKQRGKPVRQKMVLAVVFTLR